MVLRKNVSVLILFACSIFFLGCGGATTNETATTTPTTTTSAKPTVSAVVIADNTITITGTNLDGVKSVKVADAAAQSSVVTLPLTPQTLAIQSQTATQLILKPLTTLELTVGSIYNLVFADAQAGDVKRAAGGTVMYVPAP